MKNKFIEVRRGNVTVKVYKTNTVKNGQTYTSYVVSDYSKGKRKLWPFADEKLARAKAAEIADALAEGKTDVLLWEDGLRAEIRKALQAVEPTGVSLLPACQLFAEAVKILNGADQMLTACAYWTQHKPDKPITPKLVKEGVTVFLSRHKASARRHRTLSSCLNVYVRQFGENLMDEVNYEKLKQYVDAKPWKPKTRNEFLQALSQLYRYAALCHWVPAGFNPAGQVDRQKVPTGSAGVFMAWEAQQMLDRLSVKQPELVPFLAIWCFAGIRKEEIARMMWPQVNRALVTGYIELVAKDTKTGTARTVPVAPNLRAWLLTQRREHGPVLPQRWQSMTQIDEVTKMIVRKTGVVWKANAPRHSYGTYHFKLHKDAGEVVANMGTSLQKFQQNYWNKSRTVTEEEARQWFEVVPTAKANVVPMPAATGEPSTTALADAAEPVMAQG